jgi:hypothetical protein
MLLRAETNYMYIVVKYKINSHSLLDISKSVRIIFNRYDLDVDIKFNAHDTLLQKPLSGTLKI